MSQSEIYDITIIGGGPTGLFSAFYAGMRQAKTLVIESLPQLGGQLAMLYPEKHIYDVAGFPSITAKELIDNLVEQNKRFEHDYVLNETVTMIEKIEETCFKIVTNKHEYFSKTIIITAGNGAFSPRKVTLDGAEDCEEISLHYFVNDLEKFTDQDVVITGGGDSAIDWALMIEPIAKSVTLVHRRKEFRGHEHSVSLLKQSNVILKTPFVVDQLHHEDGKMKQITLTNPKEGISETIETDHLIVNFGFKSSIGPIKNWALALKGKQISVSSNMSTSIPGIFAAGDICWYPGKVELIATGLGEAPTAVNNALHFAHPEQRVQPGHSTSLFKE
ncbi:NAD(P)/FAD-dependent oxidoreductase [Vagococcus xieshaowenii]|uniref:Ferredoxin--NADP reductase n=1 Tax=Vagococcus xieshaowenii TaxID=2562451 RepID=A0AAJ5EFK3_9ENTE|nr:NAD(P)/FAD-dependent oxidoreductase [Vagococcus xieshaowenii]QCA29001.1 NAD(P)/FAD-dependent oxidoreductase [Vagococcus xieshaowenii]TFZ41023.1 NAD(P)/FAD-dependent oxidoreductase [Vagococcus xieshaowenii]